MLMEMAALEIIMQPVQGMVSGYHNAIESGIGFWTNHNATNQVISLPGREIY